MIPPELIISLVAGAGVGALGAGAYYLDQREERARRAEAEIEAEFDRILAEHGYTHEEFNAGLEAAAEAFRLFSVTANEAAKAIGVMLVEGFEPVGRAIAGFLESWANARRPGESEVEWWRRMAHERRGR